MNFKKGVKIIYIFTMLIIILFMFNYCVSAFSASEILNATDDFIKNGTPGNGNAKTYLHFDLQGMSRGFNSILLIIGIVIAMIVGVILGIKFVTGSAEEKSKIKENLIPYFIGCIVLFGSFLIWKIVVDILQKTF